MAKRPNKSPASRRVGLTVVQRPGLGSALVELSSRFRTAESRDLFIEWRRHPTTILMVEALRELGLNPPPGYLDADEIPVQYGVSAGLNLGASLLDDPSVVFPAMFGGAAPGPSGSVSSDYSSDPLSGVGGYESNDTIGEEKTNE